MSAPALTKALRETSLPTMPVIVSTGISTLLAMFLLHPSIESIPAPAGAPDGADGADGADGTLRPWPAGCNSHKRITPSPAHERERPGPSQGPASSTFGCRGCYLAFSQPLTRAGV